MCCFVSSVYTARRTAWIGKVIHFPSSLQRHESGQKQKSFGNLISLWAHLFCSAKWVSPTSSSPAFSVPLRKKRKSYLHIFSSPGSFDDGQKNVGQVHCGVEQSQGQRIDLADSYQRRCPGALLHRFSPRRPRSSSRIFYARGGWFMAQQHW